MGVLCNAQKADWGRGSEDVKFNYQVLSCKKQIFRIFSSGPDLYVQEEKEQPVVSPLWWSRNDIMINDFSRARENNGWIIEKIHTHTQWLIQGMKSN